jgi:uncharacterized protein (TIGR02453 family)
MAFEGFSEQTIDFLYGIFFQNERLWFAAHKDEYLTHLQRPMKALADETFQRLTALYPRKDLVCRVARIYRDARRCRGINFYKESLWFTLQPPAEPGQDYPCFWFELGRETWSYGMGFWMPSAATMARHRTAIDAAPQQLGRLHARLLTQAEFLLEGERYARFKTGAPPDLAGWYNMKAFSLQHESIDVTETFDGPALVERLVNGFSFLMPYYDYFLPLSQAGQPRQVP